MNNILNEEIAIFLENLSKKIGYNIQIEDTDWQVVYDLKENVINSLESLGIKIEN